MPDHEELLVQSGSLGDELRTLRDELCTEPTSQVRAAHVAAMELAATELQNASDRDDVVGIQPEPVSRHRLRALAIPLAATVGVLGLTCGLAAAGSLPGPAQRQVARVASAVGWKIPDQSGSSSPSPSGRPDPGGPGRASTSSSSSSPATSASTSTSTTANGQSNPGAVTPGTAPDGASPGPASEPVTPTTTTSPPAAPSPGKSGSAPGHAGAGTTPVAPGKSGDAPGHNKTTPVTTATTLGTSGASPGKSGSAPGHNKDDVARG